jgi:hypothetical protein
MEPALFWHLGPSSSKRRQRSAKTLANLGGAIDDTAGKIKRDGNQPATMPLQL